MTRALLLLPLCALVAACVGSLPAATEADARRVGTSLARLETGRRLYVDKCSGCHAPIAPDQELAASWPRHVEEMAERAHLGEGDRDLIVAYLTAFALDTRVASPHP